VASARAKNAVAIPIFRATPAAGRCLPRVEDYQMTDEEMSEYEREEEEGRKKREKELHT